MPFTVSEDIADEDFDSLFAIYHKAFLEPTSFESMLPTGPR